MKMCQPHWDALRAAIDARGMSSLVANSGEAAAKRMVSEIEGTATNETYDPLMQANNMIWSRALEMGGLYLMTQAPDGSDYCPLCEVEKHTEAGQAQIWIDGCTDSIRRHCEEKGLLPN